MIYNIAYIEVNVKDIIKTSDNVKYVIKRMIIIEDFNQQFAINYNGPTL